MTRGPLVIFDLAITPPLLFKCLCSIGSEDNFCIIIGIDFLFDEQSHRQPNNSFDYSFVAGLLQVPLASTFRNAEENQIQSQTAGERGDSMFPHFSVHVTMSSP